MRKAGPELLQKASARSASPRVRQPRRYRGEQAAEGARQSELPQQGGENEKRQQRRHDHLRAQRETVPRALHRLL